MTNNEHEWKSVGDGRVICEHCGTPYWFPGGSCEKKPKRPEGER